MAVIYLLIIAYLAGVLSSHSERIVGGNPTTIDNYPSIVQVELWSQVTNIWSQNCAASILTSRFVLSAAQCFTGWNLDVPYRRIRAGSTYRGIGGTVAFVDYAALHPSYGRNGLEADISVVRLLTPLFYSNTIRQATIVEANPFIPDNIAVVLAGWGRTAPGGPHSNVLRDVVVNTINNRICAERYSSSGMPITITTNMICAGILDVGGRDACDGDSGGPMFLGNVVIGVISGGYGCADATHPGVSTAVGSFTNWIVDTVRDWPY